MITNSTLQYSNDSVKLLLQIDKETYYESCMHVLHMCVCVIDEAIRSPTTNTITHT